VTGGYQLAEAMFDWRAYVEERDGKPTNFRGDEHVLVCSQCEKPKLAVNVKKRRWQCWSCAVGGRDATSLIVQAEDLRWYEAMEIVLSGRQQAIGPIDYLTKPLKTDDNPRPGNWIPKPRSWPKGFISITDDRNIGDRFRERGIWYCGKRGISYEVARGLGLGVCSYGRQADRLVFPVLDTNGGLLFYQGRAMWESDSKDHLKLLSPALDKAGEHAGVQDVLINLDTVIRLGIKRVAVVEGPVDVSHAWPDAVGTMGKNLSPRQIELLMRAGVEEIDLCYDPDAITQMLKFAPAIADLFQTRVVYLPPNKDPGDLPKPVIDDFRHRALLWGSGERLARLPFTLS